MPAHKNIQEPSPCFCVNVRRASRAITKIYDQTLAPSGLKITQYSLLKNVDAHGPLNTSELARLLTLERTTLVRNLKLLETAGLIENCPSPDPRERQVSITGQGRQTIALAQPLWKEAQRKMRQKIGVGNLELLGHLAGRLEGIVIGHEPTGA